MFVSTQDAMTAQVAYRQEFLGSQFRRPRPHHGRRWHRQQPADTARRG
jgi:hypothetical protein